MTIHILFVMLFAFFLLFVVIELTSVMTYGYWISEKRLDVYFGKHFNEYREGEKSPQMLHGSLYIPFIATSSSPSSKYYIRGLGMIPRWSKWTKELDDAMWMI